MKHTKRLCIFNIFVFFLFFVCLSVSCYAKKAFIEDIKTKIDENALFISFRVTNCFTKKMIQAIENGVNTRFIFIVRVYEVKKWWKDKKLADLKVIHSIYYDSIKKVYNLNLSERKGKKLVIRNLEEAKEVLSSIKNLKLIETKRLNKGKEYQIRIKAELDKIKLPFYLHHILFFLSLWNFETDWYKVNFTYLSK